MGKCKTDFFLNCREGEEGMDRKNEKDGERECERERERERGRKEIL